MLEIDTDYKLVIPINVENKIRAVCRKVWEVEWSGILFYTVGDIVENYIYCKDFVVLDIGTAGTTEFQMSPKVIAYMTEHDLLDCYTGLIH